MTRDWILRNKRGSEFVEASLVLPVVILTILSMILLIVFFYSCLTKQVELHRRLLLQAKSETAIFNRIEEEERVSKGIDGTVRKIFSKEISDSIYCFNEGKVLRLGDVVFNEKN